MSQTEVKFQTLATAAGSLREPEKGENLTGAHVLMSYRDRQLLGTVVAEDTRNGIEFLTVRFFNGEYWPVSPARFEVGVLVRNWDDQGEEN